MEGEIHLKNNTDKKKKKIFIWRIQQTAIIRHVMTAVKCYFHVSNFSQKYFVVFVIMRECANASLQMNKV